MGDDASKPDPLVGQLKTTLLDLIDHPYPHVPNPPQCKKRASTALVLRINPDYAHWPSPGQDGELLDASAHDRVKKFFDLDWVQHGVPELLYIKRAARKGDRWTSHVAFPGGRRDPEDTSDQAAAIRETKEEVGLDLIPENCIYIGNLPERVVTASWGTVPLMVLCPFVFLLIRNDTPPLRLQPTEVASTHWVPFTALLSPSARTYECADVSNRLATRGGPIVHWILRASLGQMLFSAVRLMPSESIYSSPPDRSYNDVLSKQTPSKPIPIVTSLSHWWFGYRPRQLEPGQSLLLWGLTLGMTADFLELLIPNTPTELWIYPTFSPPDVQFVLWIMTYRFRQRKRREIEQSNGSAPAACEEGLDAIALPKPKVNPEDPHTASVGDTEVDYYYQELQRRQQKSRSSAVGIMLEGYFEVLRKSVFVTLGMRTVLVIVLAIRLRNLYRRSRG